MGSVGAVHEERVAIVAPGASEIHLADAVGCREPAVVEHVAIGLVLGSGGGGDVGVGLAVNLTILKPSHRWAEDEVGGSLDVASLEEQRGTGIARIDGVLVAQEAAVDETQMVALGMQGHGLAQAGGIVLDGDVTEGDAAALHLHRIGAEGAHALGAVG